MALDYIVALQGPEGQNVAASSESSSMIFTE